MCAQSNPFELKAGASRATISEVRRLLVEATHPIIVLGQGMADLSGIPKLNGLREAHVFSHPEGWLHLAEHRLAVRNAEPSPAHRVLSQWALERGSDRATVMTLTTDDLFDRCGIKVVYGSGSIWKVYCTVCRTTSDNLEVEFDQEETRPCCAVDAVHGVWPDHTSEARLAERIVQLKQLAMQGDVLMFIGVNGTDLDAGRLCRWFGTQHPIISVSQTSTMLVAQFYMDLPLLEAVPLIFAS